MACNCYGLTAVWGRGSHSVGILTNTHQEWFGIGRAIEETLLKYDILYSTFYKSLRLARRLFENILYAKSNLSSVKCTC